jgi:hypothetical protein
VVYALTVAGAALVLAAAARLTLAKDAALRALRDQNPRSVWWRVSCLAARLLLPSFLAVVLLLLVSAALEGPLTTDRWAVGLGVFVGVLGNHVDREVASGWLPFWKQCHDSLRSVLPTFPDARHTGHGEAEDDCQALQFNAWHTSLLHPDERPIALERIFRASPHR